MKKMLTMALLFVMSLIPNTMKAQSYSQLWKQVEEAQSKDLPKTQIDILDKIIRKARKEQMYGHLLKAQLSRADAQIAISPDSLQPEADRLKEAEQRAAADPVLAAKAMADKMLYAQKARSKYMGQTDKAMEGRQDYMYAMSWASMKAYRRSQEFTERYNNLGNGKWKGIMNMMPRDLNVVNPPILP